MRRELINPLVLGACLLASVVLAGCSAAPIPTAESSAPAAEASERASPPQAAGEPEPIPEGSLLARADLVVAALRPVESLLEPNARVTEISESLGALAPVIEALRQELEDIDPARVSARRLEDERVAWLELQSDLAAWRRRVDERFSALQATREYLGEARGQWEATRTRATDVEAGYAPELTSRVDAILTRIIDMETRVREQRNDVAAISDRIAANQEAVSDAIDDIDDITEDVRGRMLTREAPPLWRAFGDIQAGEMRHQAIGAGRDWTRAVASFVALNPGRALFLAATFLALVVGMRQLRRQRRAASAADNGDDAVRALVERPLSVALAITLVVMLVILPVPMGSAADLLFALAVVPVARLGSVILEGPANRLLRWVVALSVLAIAASLGTDVSVVARLLLLTVTAVALVVAARAAGSIERMELARPLHRAGTTLANVFAVLLAVALGANVFGWVNLSIMLTEACIFSAFAAIGWLLVVAATRTLVPATIGAGLGTRLPSLARRRRAVTRVTVSAVGVLALFLWVRSTLVRFQLASSVEDGLARVAAGALSIGGLTISAGQLVGAATILVVTWLVARMVGFFVREEALPRLHLRRGTDESLATVSNYLIWGIGIAMSASAAGLTGTQLAVVIGSLGVGIGFGLQTIVNNFVSGLILVFERPIKVGDAIETPDYFGEVGRIGIRASVIRSFDGAEIMVPNGELISKAVTNWTGSNRIRRAEVQVGVAYGTDPERVIEILRRVAEEHPLVLDEPAIKAQMIRFGDSSLDFRLRCWTSMDNWIDVMSDLHVSINRDIEAAEITIPFPQRDLHIKSTVAEALTTPDPEPRKR